MHDGASPTKHENPLSLLARCLKIDILEQKMITFDCSQDRGEAYARDTLHISSFESRRSIRRPRTWNRCTTNNPLQYIDFLFSKKRPARAVSPGFKSLRELTPHNSPSALARYRA